MKAPGATLRVGAADDTGYDKEAGASVALLGEAEREIAPCRVFLLGSRRFAVVGCVAEGSETGLAVELDAAPEGLLPSLAVSSGAGRAGSLLFAADILMGRNPAPPGNIGCDMGCTGGYAVLLLRARKGNRCERVGTESA